VEMAWGVGDHWMPHDRGPRGSSRCLLVHNGVQPEDLRRGLSVSAVVQTPIPGPHQGFAADSGNEQLGHEVKKPIGLWPSESDRDQKVHVRPLLEHRIDRRRPVADFRARSPPDAPV
jgi:hypothetical protein